MKPKTYSILSVAVEEGVRIGYRHAHKHSETPDEGMAIANIHSEVMEAVLDYFSFDEE
jgi:hypothetical protein